MSKVNTSEKKQPERSSEPSFSEKEVNAALQIVNLLLLAWKNCSLYPEGHLAALKVLEKLRTSCEAFFSYHDNIRFSVGKNKLFWGSTVLHEVPPDNPSEDLFSILYRDGIQWLEFSRGLSRNELVYFFSILTRYRMLDEEAEGDIVTGLNEGNLEHIDFKAVDIFWEDLPLLDFSDLNPESSEVEVSAPHADDYIKDSEEPEERKIKVKSIADPSLNKALWKISPVEQEELQKMVEEEENWDNREDVLDVLLIILRSQVDQENFSTVLEFAKEEIIETIEQGEFSLLLNFFQSLHQLLYWDASSKFKWRRPVIERFFQDLSDPEIFDLITGKLILLNEDTIEEIQNLREILLYFSPSVILSLGPVILQTKFTAVRQMIIEVMEYLCLRDINPVATLLDHPDPKLVEKILPLLSRLRGKSSFNIFLKMSEHPSELVRREAARVLLERDSKSILKLFHLIDDPSLKIRRLILSNLSKQRSSVLENLLLKHIKENTDNADTGYILACYVALGRCGSNKMVPYMRKVLLKHGWNRFIGVGKPVHREGAATALALLENDQAEDILLKASNSRFKIIRNAYHKAMKTRSRSGVEING